MFKDVITFFAILAVVGALCIAADITSGQNNDSVPIELAHLGGIGLVMVTVGIVGEMCIWLLP